MDIIVSGVIVMALQPQSGVSARGNQWARQSYIIEHESGQYPKRMVFDVKDAKIQEFGIRVGEQVTLHLNVDCHEFPENSGKWFNNISAWKVERQGQQMQQGFQQQMPQQGFQQPMMQQQMVQQPMQQIQAPFPPQQPMQQQAVQSPFPPQQQMPQQQMPQQAMPQTPQMPTQQGVQQTQLPFPPAQ